jgi:hypothetical protein
VKVRPGRRERNLERALLTRNVIGETSVAVVSRAALHEVGLFDEALPSLQDLDLWLRIAGQFEVDFVPAALVRISKSDSGRISTSVDRTIEGRAMYLAKHRRAMARQRVLHRFFRDSGWVFLRRSADPPLARRCGRASIAANPFALQAYVLVALACLPRRWLDQLAQWRHHRGSWRPTAAGRKSLKDTARSAS